MKMKFAFLAAFALTASLQASTSYNFNFTAATNSVTSGAVGNNMTFTLSPGGGNPSITATATAYSTANTNVGSTALSAAEVQTYSGAGMGDCTLLEGGGNCGSPTHQIDSSVQFDFILLTFSSAVNLNSITLANFGTCSGCTVDMDMSYWTNVSTTLIGGIPEVTAVPGSGQTNVECGGSGQAACNTSITYGASNAGTGAFSATGVTSLLIAAEYTPGVTTSPDFFKIQSLNVTNYQSGASPTPEPASFVLIGSGLLIGALVGRKRMKKSDSVK